MFTVILFSLLSMNLDGISNFPTNFDHYNTKLIGRGIVSLYRPWKKSKYVPYARYVGNWKRIPEPGDLVCAHRTLPLGTLLLLTSGDSNQAVCTVLDRGTYGYCYPTKDKKAKPSKNCPHGFKYIVAAGKKKYVRRMEKGPGYYRGVIDATPSVHRLLGSSGWIKVTIHRIGKQRLKKIMKLAVKD